MRISWELRMIILLGILLSKKRIALCEYAKPCSFNQMCTCKTEETRAEVTCVRVPFYKLPDLLSEQYTHIDVVSSNLEIIDNDSFGMAQIESIRLLNNQITYIGHRAFSSMENVLRSLDLSYNKLTSFPYKALHGINHLDWLNLHSNEINSLAVEDEYSRAWSRLRDTLQTLYLSDNDICEIPENTLTVFKRLSWLNVDSNKLWSLPASRLPSNLRTLSYCQNLVQVFPADVLDRSADLSRLYVRGNYIRKLPLCSISTARRLDKLDLGENLIELEVSNCTRNVFTIRDLHLDSNRIRTLPAHAFRGISVARVYLSRNGMEAVDDRALLDIYNSLEYLDLEHNNLADIPKALSSLKRLKYLYISSNRIANISDDALQPFCASLKAISLSGNQLTKIPKSGLRKCDKLSHLNLGYNFVQDINETDFEGWAEGLDTLLLRNNRITEIAGHTFRHATKLRELSLSFNKITSVHEQAFSELKTSLESLEISFGLFQDEFAGEFLRPLSYLMWLAVDNNIINSLAPNVFHPLQNLQYLNLETNDIAFLPSGLFSSKSHKHIKDVRLSNNHLSVVRSHTFADLAELQNIIIRRNQIRKIENRSFVNLPNVINLVLSGNKIEKIEHQAFVEIPNMMKLDLQNNRISFLQLGSFVNVSSLQVPFSVNLSNNELREIQVDPSRNTPLFVKHLDLSANHIQNVPHALLSFCAQTIATLDLTKNQISKLNENVFRNLPQLENLSLKSNQIFFLHKRSFVELHSLQMLDLSENRIEYLGSDAFRSTNKLRVLNLAKNNLRLLPRDVFANTNLESLDLSSNLLSVLPSSAVSEVGASVRKLDFSNNHIEHLDGTMFAEMTSLTSLNLAANKLTILPDNVFTSVGNLLTLDLSANPVRANFKELFHYVQRLRHLNLADTSLSEVPHLPLPNLVSLTLSRNRIEKMSSASVENLLQLRRLHLDNNRFRTLPTNVWSYFVSLKELDLSNNPIKILPKDGFVKLTRLQSVNIQYLKHLERFDLETFSQNKLLTSLKVDTYPSIDRNHFHLGKFLSSLVSLRTLSVRVLEEKLEEQLVGSFHSKLKEVEITGSNLKYIHKDALKGIEKTYDLMLRIRDTKIEDFPAGLFEGVQNIAHLSLDLSNNRLVSLSPAVLYSNITNWENIGTKLLDGGLILKDNPWSCDCGLVWLGHWMRRWLRETVEIHTLVIKEAEQMENMAREATCLDQKTNQRIPIVDLHPEDLSCQASALSGDGTSSFLGNNLVGSLIKSISAICLTYHFWIV